MAVAMMLMQGALGVGVGSMGVFLWFAQFSKYCLEHTPHRREGTPNWLRRAWLNQRPIVRTVLGDLVLVFDDRFVRQYRVSSLLDTRMKKNIGEEMSLEFTRCCFMDPLRIRTLGPRSKLS